MFAVRVFGSLVIESDAGTLNPRSLGGIKPKQLFEILVSERGRIVTKDRIAELLWGDEPPKNVAATLETYVSVLRRHVRAALRTEPGAYRVEMAEIDLDLDRFDALRARAIAARDGDRARQRAARQDLAEALALVRGDVLEDEPYATWALRLREVYRQRHVHMLVDAAELAIADGDAAAASTYAARAGELDRALERAHRVAIIAHYKLGAADDALAAYQRCRTALREELGVEPNSETVALADAIRRGEPIPRPGRAVAAAAIAGHPAQLPLLGRTAESAAIERAAGDALAGAASLIVIEGEAGAGKTRLIEELVGRLGVRHVGWARCRALERDLAFAPVAQVLRSLAGETIHDPRFVGLVEIIPELDGASLGRTRAFESMVALVTAFAPVVLVIDDLQWADASSLSSIGYLLRRAEHAPVVVVGAVRSDEVAASHPVGLLDATLRIELPPLGPADLAQVGGAALHVKTGGNALFVVEYLRAREEGDADPARLRDIVHARARGAGPTGHRLLAAASVLGRSFEPGVLAQLVDGEIAEIVEQLELLCSRRLLAIAGDRFDFCHEVIRETLYEALSPARRRILHARAVEALAANDPGALAHHAECAGAYELALRSAARAGDDARRRWANLEAIAHYDRALRIADAHPELLEAAPREHLLLRLGRALTTVGRPARAEIVIGQARESAVARGDDVAMFDAVEALAVAYQHGASNPSSALELGRRALALAEQIGDPAVASRAHLLVGSPAGSLGQIDVAIEHCGHAIAQAERAGVPANPVAFGRLALAVHHRGDEHAALVWTERAEAAATAQVVEEVLLMARWVRALALIGLGRYREAWGCLDSIAQIGHGEETFWHARVPNTYGAILAETCQYERALERDLESLEAARKLTARPVREAEVQTLLNTASDRLGLGRIAEARADLEAVRRQVTEVEYARFRWVTRLHVIEAEIALAEDDAERARGAAESCLLLAAKHGQPRYEARGRIASSRALAALGKKAAALREARAAAAIAERHEFAGLVWRAWQAAFEISRSSDDRRRAEQGLARVADALDEPMRTAFSRAAPVLE